MPIKRRKKEPFKSLIFNGKYKEFTDFYDINKETIYKGILDVFEEFKTTRNKSLDLYISAKIQGLDWDTNFTFHKDESIVLKRDLMPYFEQIEDYETCHIINSLYKDLNCQNN